jgi:hypothetical protein
VVIAGKLVLQLDGNLVVYSGGTAIWQSNTSGRSSSNLLNQLDGNLVVIDPQGRTLCAFGTSGRPGAYLVMQNDGHLAVYAPGLWGDLDSAQGGKCL